MTVNPHSLAQNAIDLKTVADLAGYSFQVPSYQRGYRWTETQVTELLDDLEQFERDAPPGTYYCLQPVVVQAQPDDLAGSTWELIDGHQRLTTICLLLGLLNQLGQEAATPFGLNYATRPRSREFLRTLLAWPPDQPDDALETQAQANIDFHFLHRAWRCLRDWLRRHPQAVKSCGATLQQRVQLIWYELAPGLHEDEAHQAFIRLNSGKIPLTSAELVKALFLRRLAGDDDGQLARRQIEIATEWDRMEARLHEPEFWFFLHRVMPPAATRISFLFELQLKLEPPTPDEEEKLGHGGHRTFLYFSHRLHRAGPAVLLQQWQQLKHSFMTLESWYADRGTYHRLGYLLAVGEPLETLMAEHAKHIKPAFGEYITQRIRSYVGGSWQDWTYPDYRLPRLLLLLNSETMRHSSGSRFPFAHYKGYGDESQRWSLEHIHAQNPKRPTRPKEYRDWLKDAEVNVEKHTETLSAPPASGGAPVPSRQQVLNELALLRAQAAITAEEFGAVQAQVFLLLGEPDVHTVGNLALLAAADNAALGNRVFADKRQRVMKLERDGKLIPVATRYVFLKYYTKHPDHLSYWTQADREEYVHSIGNTLQEYLDPA